MSPIAPAGYALVSVPAGALGIPLCPATILDIIIHGRADCREWLAAHATAEWCYLGRRAKAMGMWVFVDAADALHFKMRWA